jgi:hypothetical protein
MFSLYLSKLQTGVIGLKMEVDAHCEPAIEEIGMEAMRDKHGFLP